MYASVYGWDVQYILVLVQNIKPLSASERKYHIDYSIEIHSSVLTISLMVLKCQKSWEQIFSNNLSEQEIVLFLWEIWVLAYYKYYPIYQAMAVFCQLKLNDPSNVFLI